MTAESLDNPILNSPYEAPGRHFALGPNGPTGEILVGRRPSESFIPIPPTRKGKAKTSGKAGGKANGSGTSAPEPSQTSLDFDITGERREQNSLINDIRQRVELWRGRNYPGVTPVLEG